MIIHDIFLIFSPNIDCDSNKNPQSMFLSQIKGTMYALVYLAFPCFPEVFQSVHDRELFA